MSGRSGMAGRIRSFRFALRGLAEMLRTQPNARIHAAASGLTVLVSLALGVSRWEWIALLLAMGLVWAAEAVNTAFEALCDVASPEFHPQVERAKDVAAAAVLLAAAGALGVATLVFGPRIVDGLGRVLLAASG